MAETYDSVEYVQKCLNCEKPRCINCLERVACSTNTASPVKVNQIDDTTGEIIATFKSINEAVIATGVSHWFIRQCLLGKRKTGGGFRWERVK